MSRTAVVDARTLYCAECQKDKCWLWEFDEQAELLTRVDCLCECHGLHSDDDSDDDDDSTDDDISENDSLNNFIVQDGEGEEEVEVTDPQRERYFSLVRNHSL